MSGSIIALPATTRGGLLFGLPTQRLKGRLGWRPHLIFSNCQTRLLPSATAFSLVAKIAKLVKRLSTSSVEKLSPISEKFAKTRAEALARS